MSHDHYIEFEEDNFDTLVDGFIKKYQDKWDEFVYDEYASRPIPEPPEKEM